MCYLLTEQSIICTSMKALYFFLTLPPPTKFLLEAQKNKKLGYEMSLTHQQHPNFF